LKDQIDVNESVEKELAKYLSEVKNDE